MSLLKLQISRISTIKFQYVKYVNDLHNFLLVLHLFYSGSFRDFLFRKRILTLKYTDKIRVIHVLNKTMLPVSFDRIFKSC
jgi:hypothetical protein